ncbi:MAG: glycosyltransferase [Solirubrobacteraceae bacterium]
MSHAPEITVAVPSHDRPLRLRWLLNALEAQTLPRERWEVVVAHDSAGPETEHLLRTHPLAREGVLRHATLPAGTGGPGAHRNAAVKLARGEVIAFTDDDCRPPADWLEKALAAARRHPGAIVQGTTLKDPTEAVVLNAPLIHSQLIRPPTVWAEACNIIYPKELLDRVGGFHEDAFTGEDTDLAVRCKQQGAAYVAAPEVVTHHAVVEVSAWDTVRAGMRWVDLPLLLKRHPEFRDELPLWFFWKRTHVWLIAFFVGVKLSRRSWLFNVLCVPWLVHATPKHGNNPRGRFRSISELPLWMAIDLAEMIAMARGSVRHRTVVI